MAWKASSAGQPTTGIVDSRLGLSLSNNRTHIGKSQARWSGANNPDGTGY